MAYGYKYYFTFKDVHATSPITWRVDILDNEGVIPSEPFLLTASVNPLITERIETSEQKDTYVIGRQVTISYEYTGEPNIPLPKEFFEASERRFRVEVRKNGVLDGVYYVKPDFCEYDEKYPPFTVQLKAVDGLGYANAVPFNIYGNTGLLEYSKIDLYEAIMTRALLLVLDPDTKINVLNSLYPTNIPDGVKLLFGTFVHTDMFFDFVKGASTVHDVITAFAKSMYSRCYICNNEVWFLRTQDLISDNIVVDQYTSGSAVDEVSVPSFILSVGNNPAMYDAARIDNVPRIRMIPAIKRAEFEAEYKSINRLSNFDWSQWDGVNFADWDRFEQSGNPISISRVGSGTIDDPYRFYFPLNQPPGSPSIIQQTALNEVFAGDILEVSFRYRLTNAKRFYIRVRVGDSSERYFTLDEGGSWIYTFGTTPGRLFIGRSGKKREGTFSIKSLPIPTEITESVNFPSSNNYIEITIGPPLEEIFDDGPLTPALEVWPIKVGAIPMESKGRHITVVNEDDYSQEKDVIPFRFIDTGAIGLSNTLFIGNSSSSDPAESWDSGKTGVEPADIERHMARAHIDQYPRSITSWEGSLYSNSIEFFNLIRLDTMPDKLFMQMSDKYNNMACTHDILLMELFAEGNASVEFSEYDVEEVTD